MGVETEQTITSSVERVLEVAKQQKRLIWLIVLGIILATLFVFMVPLSSGSALWILLSLILRIISAYLVFKIGRAMEISTLWLVITIVLLFVPYIDLLPLLYMNSKATKFLRAAGVQVGLMGAKRKSMDRICELQ